MSLADKKKLAEACIFTPIGDGRWGLPFVAWGDPGVAKTSVLDEIASSYGFDVVVLEPGAMGEGGFGVVPVPEGGVLRFPPPEWVETVENGGIVFLDEISSTPPALTPALLGILLARRVGFHKLHKRVRVIGAANPPEVAASGFDLPPPMANRTGHIDWPAPSVEEHTAYMMRPETSTRTTVAKKHDAEAKEEAVLASWPNAWARAVGIETAFLRSRPELKNRLPKNVESGKAWPSDRTWEYATRAIATAQVHGLSGLLRDELVIAYIGDGAGKELLRFLREADLPDPAAVLDGRLNFQHRAARPDVTVAVLNSCAALVVPSAPTNDKTAAEIRKARAARLWGIVDNVIKADEADLARDCIGRLVDAQLVQGDAIKTMAKMQRELIDPANRL